jgi:hypothetical protein
MNAEEIISVNCSNQNVPSKKGQNSAEKLDVNQARTTKREKDFKLCKQ